MQYFTTFYNIAGGYKLMHTEREGCSSGGDVVRATSQLLLIVTAVFVPIPFRNLWLQKCSALLLRCACSYCWHLLLRIVGNSGYSGNSCRGFAKQHFLFI